MTPPAATDRSADGSTQRGAYQLFRTGSGNAAFRELVMELDKDLAIRDGDDHAFYAQFNKIDHIKNVIVVMEGPTPVGCGAFKAFAEDAVEIKRMYTAPTHRQRGLGSLVLSELERWAYELGYKRCVLETGQKQPEAIALYTKRGFRAIPNYGQYVGVESSVCFGKEIHAS